MGNLAARLNVQTTSTRSRIQAAIARAAHVGRECVKKVLRRYVFCISNLPACELQDLGSGLSTRTRSQVQGGPKHEMPPSPRIGWPLISRLARPGGNVTGLSSTT